MSPEESLQAFRENEIRAEETYRGQRLQLTGRVGSIQADIWGDGGVIEFRGDFLRHVEAHFLDGLVLADLSRGQRVTVLCHGVEGESLTAGARLRDCELSQTETGSTATVSEAEDAGAVSRTADREPGQRMRSRRRRRRRQRKSPPPNTRRRATPSSMPARTTLRPGSTFAALGADPERLEVLFPLSVAQMKTGADSAARESFADLLDAGLPLELAATHDHSFGNCQGTFRLTKESVSYRSPRESNPDHRFDVPLGGVLEAGLRDGKTLRLRARSAEHVEQNEGDSKNWTFRFHAWDANAEIASLIFGYLSGGR